MKFSYFILVYTVDCDAIKSTAVELDCTPEELVGSDCVGNSWTSFERKEKERKYFYSRHKTQYLTTQIRKA